MFGSKKKDTVEFKIGLGDEVRDKISGLKGKVTTRAECLNGCHRYTVQPGIDKDGKMPDSYWLDEQQLEYVNEGETSIKKTGTGGPVEKAERY